MPLPNKEDEVAIMKQEDEEAKQEQQ